MEPKNLIRNKFKAPEGPYQLVAEKVQGLIQFSYQRPTRLTWATLQGGGHPEDGTWVLFNVGDCLHVCTWDATHKEPTRTLYLGNASSRTGYITCHDFAPSAPKDGVDTVVGLGDGSVLLLSLRAQLSAAPNSKPLIASTLTPEAGSETARCTAVVWLPRSEGMFAAAFGSGAIFLYKKSSILGDSGGGGRFSLGNSKSTNPHTTFTIAGGGINDLAASPCGSRLAAACRDGAMRLIEVATGTVIGGFQSYYGAMLCCSFSPDGRYIAAAGEDDLIGVYSVMERCPVAHCQGHDSWVSRVKWDPWMQLGGGGAAGTTGTSSTQADSSTASSSSSSLLPLSGQESAQLYRLASVGQDTALCLWDVQMLLPVEGGAGPGGDLFGPAGPVVSAGTALRKSTSTAALNSPSKLAADSASAMHFAGGSATNGGATTGHHQRKPSVSKPAAATGAAAIVPALPHAEMNLVQPSMQHRIHLEPLSDILFSEHAVYTADHSGCVRTWRRPPGLHERPSDAMKHL